VNRNGATGFPWTGQTTCHDQQGVEMPCEGSGQDAEFRRGRPWPQPRFSVAGDRVTDLLTGLQWPRKANYADFPLQWNEALAFIVAMNEQKALGFDDWRLPNRRELRSLISMQTRKPALPEGHPFTDVFPGWYWTSTSAAIAPDHAWYVSLDGGRMFYGGKDQSFLVLPVRGQGHGVLPKTGQTQCYDAQGEQIPCAGSGQDGEWQIGAPWPSPRFQQLEDGVLDRLTDLVWWPRGDFAPNPVNWREALQRVAEIDRNERRWRLPNINELESLVDCARARPALPEDAPFTDLRDVYWSSTTSLYEPDWAWALYLEKGAVGVGQKNLPEFYVWPVSDGVATLL